MDPLQVGESCPLKMYDGETWHIIGRVERRGLLLYVWTRNDGSSGTARTARGAALLIQAPYKPQDALTPL